MQTDSQSDSVQQARSARIIVGGDVCPGALNEENFRKGDGNAIFHDLLVEFKSSDLVVINLESPLVSSQQPIIKTGLNFGLHPSCISGITGSGIGALNLANNHIMDHGPLGLMETVKICRRSGIDTFGAGENLEGAGRLLVKKIKGIRVGFIGMADHEFSIAGPDSWGANPLDPIAFVRTVRRDFHKFDYLVALVHAGAEHYPFPSPRLQKTCRFFVEEGAHAVICQHSHCPGSIEWYRDSPIVYGQGNLIADSRIKVSIAWHQGFLVKLTLHDPGLDMEIIPYFQSFNGPGARHMNEEEELAFRQILCERSKVILDDDFVQKKWLDFCISRESDYLSLLRGHSQILKRLNAQFGFAKRFYSGRGIAALLNVIRCQIHHEILETILDSLDKQRNLPTEKADSKFLSLSSYR